MLRTIQYLKSFKKILFNIEWLYVKEVSNYALFFWIMIIFFYLLLNIFSEGNQLFLIGLQVGKH